MKLKLGQGQVSGHILNTIIFSFATGYCHCTLCLALSNVILLYKPTSLITMAIGKCMKTVNENE